MSNESNELKQPTQKAGIDKSSKPDEFKTKVLDELTKLGAEIDIIRVRVDGMPLLGNAIDNLQRDIRLVRAAINGRPPPCGAPSWIPE